MDQILGILMERLSRKGMEINTVPAYIRDLSNSIANNRFLSLKGLNRRLQSLGWDDFELDDHTLQLIIANLETHAFDNSQQGKHFLI